MDLEGSAGKASENHKFLYHSFTFESRSTWLGSCLQISREIFVKREIFVQREILHLRWIKCRFALSSPPGFFVDLVDRSASRSGRVDRRDHFEETSVLRSRLYFQSGIVIGVCWCCVTYNVSRATVGSINLLISSALYIPEHGVRFNNSKLWV